MNSLHRSLPRSISSLLLIGSLSLGACAPGMGGSPGAGSSSSKDQPGKASPEALAGLAKISNQNADQCEQKTDDANKKLADAIAKMQGGQPDATGKPAPSMSDAVAKLRKSNVTVTIDVLGSPDMPLLMMKDSVMAEGATLQGAPPAKLQAYAKKMMASQPQRTALNDTVQAVNKSMGSAFMSTISCNGFAQGLTRSLGALDNGDNDPSPDLMAAYKRMLQASARSKSVVSGSIAMLSVMQAGLAGKDPKGVDALLDGLKKMQAAPEEVTDDQAKATYKAAGQELVDACRAQMEQSYKDHPNLQRPAVDPCSKEGSKVRGAPPADGASADSSSGSGGGGDMVDDAIKRLIPKNTPLSDASDALLAVKNGDFLGALKSAAKLAGRVSPLGGALSTVLGLFG